MDSDQLNEEKYLEELVARRKQLFQQFLRNPTNTRPALDIKVLDDKIWELRFRMQMPVRSSTT